MVVERAVGDELRVHVDERIGAEARGEDVGIGLSEFVPQGTDVEIRRHDPVDGGVDREAIGRPFIVENLVVDGRGWALD